MVDVRVNLRGMAGVATGLLLAGCLGCTAPSVASRPPRWVDSPKQSDGLYQYALGQASECSSREEARQRAFQNALGFIARSIYADVQVEGDAVRVSSDLTFNGVEIVPQSEYYRENGGTWSGWVQVSYPEMERKKLKDGLALGKKLQGEWAAVQSARNSGLWRGVAEKCPVILKTMPESIGFRIPREEIQMALGESLEKQTRYGEAWEFYQDVVKYASNEVWKGKAAGAIRRVETLIPAHWVLRDRWNQRRVVQVCSIRDGQGLRPFPELAAIVNKKWTEIALQSVDLSPSVKPDTVLEQGALSDAAFLPEALAQKGGVLITVIYDIDESRRGKTQDLMGTTVPMIDTWIKFRVTILPEGQMLFSGQFKEVTGKNSLNQMAERAGSILFANYLVKKCPAISAP